MTNFDDSSFLPSTNNDTIDDSDNLEVLLERAQRAKRKAAATRKQIPPFVQKLSSFLNEEKNTDFIRWSEKGDSFIVLDEDEFAKNLIPELFKHNNYASFVRQLNMYGFHKRVGLSDNSMKASERKNKSPSEYHNPYFRKGYPDLLWLINKPKSSSGKKKKKDDGDVDSDDEVVAAEDSLGPGPPRKVFTGELTMLQKKDLTTIREQIKQLQDTQTKLQVAIARIDKGQKDLMSRAAMFQHLHDRHDRSINLILSFLANVYRKSLQDSQDQNVAEVLASLIPNQNSQGSVIDLEGFTGPAVVQPNVGTAKRPQRLLPPVPQYHQSSTMTPSPTSAGAPSGTGFSSAHYPQMGSVTEVIDPSPADTATTPAYLKQSLETNPHESMLKIMEGATPTAPSGSSVDIPAAVANTASVLSDDQRDQMLNIIAAQSSAPEMTLPTSASVSPSISTRDGVPSRNYGPSISVQSATQASAIPKVSPTAATAAPATSSLHASVPTDMNALSSPLSLHQLGHSPADIQEIQRLQEEASHQINDLAQFLGPLSPSGRIPGIDENGNPVVGSSSNGSSGYFYMEQFLNSDAFHDTDGGAGFDESLLVNPGVLEATHDLNSFTLDPAAGYKVEPPGPGQVEALSTGVNTPSPAATEEITRDDMAFPGDERDVKRRRI